VQVDTGANPARIADILGTIETEIELTQIRNPGLTHSITGSPAIDRATFLIIMNDFAQITGIAFALVMAVILLIFRNVRALIPLSIVMVGIIWTMGLAGYLALEITVVSMVSAAMIMGLGIDFGIHVYHGYTDRRKTYGSARSARETLAELLRAMLGASLTTSAGFLALLFGVLPAMKVLSIMLTIGIISTMLAAALLLLPILMLTDRGLPQ
jgi:predicted RND superfamily exporter protein